MADKKSTRAARGNGIGKIEGVRRALKELGPDAKPGEIQGFVKKRFGIEMTKDHISVSKGDIRRQAAKKKLAAKKAEARKEPAPQPLAEPAASPQPTPGSGAARQAQEGQVNKLEGVRRALKELGKEATSLDIQSFLKQRFGLEVARDLITKYKSHLLIQAARKKQAKAKPPARMPAAKEPEPKPQVQPSAASASPAKGSSGKGGIQLEDIGAVKELIGRVGADGLRKLIDLLAR